MKRRLIVSAHADDETIGCGGMMVKYSAAGASIFVGVLSREADDEAHKIRLREAEKAWAVLGVEDAEWALSRARPLTISSDLVDSVGLWLSSFRPDIVFVPHEDEQDPDHAVVAQVVRSAMLQSGRIRPILGYEVWTPIRRPALFEDVTGVTAKKAHAIAQFASQIRERDYGEGAAGLNRFRGVMSGVGNHVEAFSLVGM